MICQRMMVRGVKTVPDVWQFTINTEATTPGEKKTGVPLNLYGQDDITVTVDWGDGTKSTLDSSDYTQSDSRASTHEYISAGIYTVKIKSSDWGNTRILSVRTGNEIETESNKLSSLYWWRRTLITIDTVIPLLKGSNYYSSLSASTLSKDSKFNYLFARCLKLTLIPLGLFEKNTTINGYQACFYRCESLTTIPSGLFANNPNVTSFLYCFQNCTALTTIPSGLFDDNINAEDFSGCFLGCTSISSIPNNLFDNNTLVTDFTRCFHSTSLVSIPNGLFDKNVRAANFTGCFESCALLTTVPAELFDYNTAVTNFSSCFAKCTTLSSIPENLFKYNISVTNFSDCFYNTALVDTVLHIGSSIVAGANRFINSASGVNRIIYVPSGSTTETTFNTVATDLGLTVIGE